MAKDEKTIREQLHTLLDIALDTNGFESRRKDTTGVMPTVIFEYSGHVHRVMFKLHPNGWCSGDRGIYLIDRLADAPIPEEEMRHVQAECKKALECKSEVDVLAFDIAKLEGCIKDTQEVIQAKKRKLEELLRKEARNAG